MDIDNLKQELKSIYDRLDKSDLEPQSTQRPIVEIEWIDAQSSLQIMNEQDIRDFLQPLKSKSVGYLIHENSEYIVLGFTDFGDGMIKHHQLIPHQMIKKVNFIRGKREDIAR